MKSLLPLSLLVFAGMAAGAVAPAAPRYEAFHPGQLWLDNQGKHINAHGGGILFHQGVYYWFGEHKIEGKAGNEAHVGVHCYSSRDLYNWTDEGIALQVSKDPNSDITEGCILERPKIICNKETGKFVMYFHLEMKGQGYNAARTGIAVANAVTGPYSFARSLRPNAGHWPVNVNPEQKSRESIAKAQAEGDGFSGSPSENTRSHNILGAHFAGGQMSRDMTLFVDDDGKAYHIFASEHNSTLHIAELTDDYLGHSGKYVRVFEHRWMEAPAICKRNGKYHLIASGCTGWDPNAARSAVADSIWGPWTELGNPCEGTNPENGFGPEKTFGGQSTFILPVQGKADAFIAMFDLWRPDNAIDGRYLWLPVILAGDGFKITWRNEWNLRSFDKSGAGAALVPICANAGNLIPATAPGILKVGRWLPMAEGSLSAAWMWSASYLRVRFTGDRLALCLGDSCHADTVVDGGGMTSMECKAGLVEVAANLKEGEHEACVALSKWSSTNPIVLNGIILGAGAKLLPPPARRKLIEFIGDSITAGTFQNYAWLAAEQLGADHIQIAIPGIGLLDGRPNHVSPTTGMAWQYFKATSDLSRRDVPDWDFHRDQPDLIVINLGTNDDGKGVKDEEFSAGLIAFIQKIRLQRPGIPIVVLEPFGGFRKSAPDLGDWFRFLEPGIAAAVQKLNQDGDAKVHVCITKGWLTTETAGRLISDNVHPNASGHQMLAGKVAAALRPYLPSHP